MNQEIALPFTRSARTEKRNSNVTAGGSMFEQQLIQQLLVAFTPQVKALIKDVLSGEVRLPLIVDYEEAGRMIGTTYEGVRKLVRKGRLASVSRSGRNRGIAVAELKDYVLRGHISAQRQRELVSSSPP